MFYTYELWKQSVVPGYSEVYRVFGTPLGEFKIYKGRTDELPLMDSIRKEGL